MVSNKEICSIHKKPIIYTYNNENYCKECLDDKFKVIEEIKKYHAKAPFE